MKRYIPSLTNRRYARTFNDGEIIFKEGDDSHEMYIIQDGEIVITKSVGKESVLIAVLGRGEFFGEMALLESLPRSATATAKGKTKLYAVPPGGFLLKIRRDPTLAFEILQSLCRRIRVTNEKFLATLSKLDTHDPALAEFIDRAEFKVEKHS